MRVLLQPAPLLSAKNVHQELNAEVLRRPLVSLVKLEQKLKLGPVWPRVVPGEHQKVWVLK